MAKCKVCGGEVKAANVWHTACWETEVKKVAEIFCETYCRHPLEHPDESECAEQHCCDCALIRLVNLGL